MALFEVLTHSTEANISAIIPSAQPRGLFWVLDGAANSSAGVDASENLTVKLAGVSDPILLGYNGREATTTGLRTDAQILFNEGLESYDKVGGYASISRPPILMAIEDDSTHIYVDSSNPPTAVGDICNFLAGKLQKAQTSQLAHYKVVGKIAGVEDTTQSRFILEKITATMVA